MREESLMFSTDEVRIVFDSLRIALVTTDNHRRIVRANKAAYELFGYEPGELENRLIECLIPPHAAAKHPEHYDGFVKTPTTRAMGAERDLLALRKDGSVFPVEIGLTVLPGEPAQYLASVLDLTLRKKNEILLKERGESLQLLLDDAKKDLEQEISERTRLAERQRLGRELHDSLSQNLYGIGLGLRTALAKIKKNADPTGPIDYCLGLTEASLVEMRALLFKLRPKSLEDVPLADVLSSHAQAVTARTKLPIRFAQHGERREELPFELKYTVYRVATEAVYNCIKHANATFVEIHLTYGLRGVGLRVIDDGTGFDLTTVSFGHGLEIMKERASSAGGELEFESSERGTTVLLSLPQV